MARHWRLVKLRKLHNVNQESMAKLIGVNTRTYALKELGETDFKLEEIFIIARYFDKPIEEIFLPRNIRNTDN